MGQIVLKNRLLLKLRKESDSNREVLSSLCGEAVARRWLKTQGIPSWRNPVTPGIKRNSNYSKGSGYSVMLTDGSRFLVCSYPSAVLSREKLAAAKCFAALAVKVNSSNTGGSVMGCIFLRDTEICEKQYSLDRHPLRPASELPDFIADHAARSPGALLFSARLLLSGEPDAPEYGTKGVEQFNLKPVTGRRLF
jgi:hypothetical protein